MDRLFLLLSSADTEVHYHASFMYAYNAKLQNWFDKVVIIVWGPSERVVAEDKEFTKRLQELMNIGIEVIACKACSDDYGVSKQLENAGITVEYVGKRMTQMLKDGWKQLTF